MNPGWWIIPLFALLWLAVDFWARIEVRLAVEKAKIDLESQNRGTCGKCAFHNFLIREGAENRDSTPEPHRCCEGMKRWRGALHERTLDE